MSQYDPSDPAQVKPKQEREKTRKLRSDNGFKKLMQDQEGRMWVWQFLTDCSLYCTTFDPSNAKTAFNEGMRNAGLRVMADIHRICPDLYLKMVNENQKENTDG